MKQYLFVCTRESFDITKSIWVIGFHDRSWTLNIELPKVEIGDRIYFYISKERVLVWFASVTETLYYDDKIIYPNSKELCIRRLGVKINKNNSCDFNWLISKLDFIKKKEWVVWSAYLVKNFIKLSDHDIKIFEDALSNNPNL